MSDEIKIGGKTTKEWATHILHTEDGDTDWSNCSAEVLALIEKLAAERDAFKTYLAEIRPEAIALQVRCDNMQARAEAAEAELAALKKESYQTSKLLMRDEVRLSKELAVQDAELKDLRESSRVMREALEYYASGEHLDDDLTARPDDCEVRKLGTIEEWWDPGRTARQAIAAAREKG